VIAVARHLRRRSALTHQAGAGHHDARVELTRHGVAEAELVDRPGREALDVDVGPGDQAPGDLDRRRLLQVQQESELGRVELAEELRAVPARLPVLVGRDAAQVVGPQLRLDAHDRGTVVGEAARRDRPHPDPREVGDLETLERQLAPGHSRGCSARGSRPLRELAPDLRAVLIE
jgi:hypothetical protein